MRKLPPIRLGVSSCLLGQKVRYDGGHKRDRFVVDTLGKYFELVPVCPEVAVGLGVPRPPIRLVGRTGAPRAVGVENPALDVTRKLAAYGRRQAHALDDLGGYVFKSRSPSCGLANVRVFAGRGRVGRDRGVYSAAFTVGQPLLPVEEEGRLDDSRVRDHFLERVFAWRRWQALLARGLTPARLAAFHAAHELSLRAHGPAQWRTLGRLAARADRRNVRRVAEEYACGFMAALARPATRARHAGVLAHVRDRLGDRLGDRLDDRERTALAAAVRDYRAGRQGLAVPLTLLRRLLRRHPDGWAASQAYLRPDAREAALRRRS